MRKRTGSASLAESFSSNKKLFAKVFIINSQFSPSEDIDLWLSEILESGSCKKIVPLKPFDDDVDARRVKEAIEAAQRQIDNMWGSLPGDLESEMRTHWIEGAHAASEEAQDTKDEDETKNIPYPNLISTLIPNSDKIILFNELLIRDLVFPDYFLVIFWRATVSLIKDLLSFGVCLSAIIYFIPCPVSDLETKFPTLHNDFQDFQKTDVTKHIGFFTAHLNIDTLLTSTASQIYEQLKTFLFDVEMLSQHFLIYQSDFIEIDDSTVGNRTPPQSFQGQSFNKYSDDTVVCIFLDNLCCMVERQSTDKRQSIHPRPFLQNDFSKIIIEDANELLKSTIATQRNMEAYGKSVDVVINAIHQTQGFSNGSMNSVKLPLYKELLSWEAFVQRLDGLEREYDSCSRKDLSEEFQLIVFRRTLHRILETIQRIQVPTRLCFRDFCIYIAPKYAEVIRGRRGMLLQHPQDQENEESMKSSSSGASGPEKATYFSGLTFDDTFQELTVVERVFRFHRSGFIRVKLENWLHKDPKLTVAINFFNCLIFAHHWDKHLPTMFPRVRLVTKNGIACNVEMTKSNISITWPNDCQIRYVCENDVRAVEQSYHRTSTEEYKRVYTDSGCVLVCLKNGNINVLTPSGILYQLFPKGFTESFDITGEMTSTDVSTELEFVRSLRSHGIDCRSFDVTRNDGRMIRVLDGVTVEERANFLVYEWTDPASGEMFAERDDGVKQISSHHGLKTYYPCGTMIHTVAEEKQIELDLDCRSLSTENILRKINPDIVKWLEDRRVHQEPWISFSLTYHIHYAKFASITVCDGPQMVIQSPGGVKVTVTDDVVLIDVGSNVTVRFSPDLCTVKSSHDKGMSMKLHLTPKDGDILCYQSTDAKVTLKESGELISDENCSPMEPCDEDLYFLAKQGTFGIAFLPDHEFQSIVKKYKPTPFFHETDKKVALLRHILPINARFSMPIPGMDSNLDKFVISKCGEKPREKFQPEHAFSARTIIKLDDVPKDFCDFLRGYTDVGMTLASNIREALDHWFGVKPTKDKYSLAWREKIRDTKKEIQKHKQRGRIYQAMVLYKVFPKYQDLREGEFDVDKVDLDKLAPELAKKGFRGRSAYN